MLDPILRIALISAGGCLFLLAFVGLWKDLKSHRISGRTLAAYYVGAILILVGLQPIRPFEMQYRSNEIDVLSSFEAHRKQRLEDLRQAGWIIGAARPESLVDRDHPRQPEVEQRFQEYVRTHSSILDQEGLDFVFVGREVQGWSLNPETSTLTFMFLAVVLIGSGLRHLVRIF